MVVSVNKAQLSLSAVSRLNYFLYRTVHSIGIDSTSSDQQTEVGFMKMIQKLRSHFIIPCNLSENYAVLPMK